jgi:hypothetical protein
LSEESLVLDLVFDVVVVLVVDEEIKKKTLDDDLCIWLFFAARFGCN